MTSSRAESWTSPRTIQRGGLWLRPGQAVTDSPLAARGSFCASAIRRRRPPGRTPTMPRIGGPDPSQTRTARFRSSGCSSSHAAIADHVGNEQRKREEDEAEEEEEEEAVSLACGNAGRPEGDGDPENGQEDEPEHVLPPSCGWKPRFAASARCDFARRVSRRPRSVLLMPLV